MEPTVEQLKAAAYDSLAAIEYHQKLVAQINVEVNKRNQPEQPEEKKEVEEVKPPTPKK
jgi:hypothetical protein